MKYTITPRLFISKIFAVILLSGIIVTGNIYETGSLLSLILELLGYSMLFAAAIGRAWSSAYISGKKSKELVAYGPYSLTRNPLYFFSFLGYAGAGLAFKSLSLTLGMTILFFLTHWKTIMDEENGNKVRFEKDYPEYSAKVPRFIPSFGKLINPSISAFYPVPFSRAILGCSYIAYIFMAARIIEWCQSNSILPVLLRLP